VRDPARKSETSRIRDSGDMEPLCQLAAPLSVTDEHRNFPKGESLGLYGIID
jgi:hypothetical protein